MSSDTAAELMQEAIRLQQKGDYTLSISIFDKVLEIDPKRETAYNSKGLTFKYAGQLDEALKCYELALDAHCGKIFKSLSNDRSNTIYEHKNHPGEIADEWCVKTAIYTSIKTGGISSCAMPDGDSALEEAKTHRHEGLLWVDYHQNNGLLRYFLPNYFNTMKKRLTDRGFFSRVVNNIGCVYLGKCDAIKAEQSFYESIAFIPEGDDYDMPHRNLYDMQQKG